MRQSRHGRSIAAATAAVTAVAVLSTGFGTAEAAPPSDRGAGLEAQRLQQAAKAGPVRQSRQLRRAVKVRGIQQHLDAFAGIAEANGGNRASGTEGYRASRDYVVRRLRDAGYRPTVQQFDFPYFAETSPSTLRRTSPNAKDYAADTEFAIMEYSGSGDVTAPVVVVDTALTPTETSTSGCEAADFAGFPVGAIALMQRGTCNFAVKVANADAAGAAAALIFNRGTAGEDGVLLGTLGEPSDLPALGLSFAAGLELAAAGTQARVFTETLFETRTTWNVFAETARGNPSNVIMAGAHLDSVEDGAGINDNGSGSATVLEVAEELAKTKQGRLRNRVRFAWWGAEENGLLGAYDYVDGLVANNPGALEDIAAYLNFDMVGSPNFVRFVYDGDNSTGEGEEGPEGSAQLEDLFTRYFSSRGLRTSPTAFDGRSDYGPFIENGIAAGGLFTGAEGIKTPREARVYGGRAGEAYDPCYHQACDDLDNISTQALDQMSDAVAHSVYTLARSTASLDGLGARRDQRSAAQQQQRARAADLPAVGHGVTS